MDPFSSLKLKNLTSVCLVQIVGAWLLLMIHSAARLSTWIPACLSCGNPSFWRTNLGHHAAFASVKAAMNSASVELDAVAVWVLLLHAVAPPGKVETHPVIDLCFLGSEP